MGLIFDSIFLYFLTTIFGDYNDTSSRWKVFGIVIASVAVPVVLVLKFHVPIDSISLPLLSIAIVVVLLVFWCRIALLSAIKIAAIFLVVRVVLTMLFHAITSS